MWNQWFNLERQFYSEFDRAFHAMDALRRHVDRNEVVAGKGLVAPLKGLEVVDQGDHVLLEVALPGLREDEVELTVNRDVVTLKGSRRVTAPEGYSVHRQERQDYTFSRSLTLPVEVDAERSKAELKDGLLRVTMAKAVDVAPRRIAVVGA